MRRRSDSISLFRGLGGIMIDRMRVQVTGPIPFDSRVVAHLGKTGTVVSQDATGALIAFDDDAEWFLWSELQEAS